MILILGQARTGTSMTAGILSALGYDFGDMEPPNEWNPRGNFVDRCLNVVNFELYHGQRLMGGAITPPDSPWWVAWQQLLDIGLKKKLWGVKDHAILPLLTQFAEYVRPRDPHFKVVLCTRDPDVSLQSFVARRGDSNPTNAEQYQRDCQTLIDNFLSAYRPPLLTLQFEESANNPRCYVESLASYVGLSPNDAAYGAIDPALHRFTGPTAPQGPPLIVRGWNFATAMARWTFHGMPRRSQDEIDQRLAICQSCQFLNNDTCMKCGCVCVEQNRLINKLALASEKCPEGKWQ